MIKKELKADFLLLLTAAIWGFAFVAQRVSMNFIGPFTFNVARFFLGSIFLFLLIFLKGDLNILFTNLNEKKFWISSLIAGTALFLGASLQQIGIIYTTAGKAGFITGLYVVLVPLFGIVIKHKSSVGNWIGAIMALIGLYFLSVTERMTIEYGDSLVLIGAFCWASHVLIIDNLSKKFPALALAFMQFFICAIIV
jgi:drug/metabolite transporter (DMT)-like permease